MNKTSKIAKQITEGWVKADIVFLCIISLVMSNSLQQIYSVSINFCICTVIVNDLMFFLDAYLDVSVEIPLMTKLIVKFVTDIFVCLSSENPIEFTSHGTVEVWVTKKW